MGGNASKSDPEAISRPSVQLDSSGETNSPRSSYEGVPAGHRLHQGPVHSICPLSQDTIFSGGIEKNVNLYNWKEKFCITKFSGPVKEVTKICYNNTSEVVYASSRDRSLYGWKWPKEQAGEESSNDVESGHIQPQPVEPSLQLQGHTLGVSALDTSDDFPQLLCSGSRDNSVCLWDVDVGKPVSSMYVPRNIVTDLKWIVKEKSVIQASEDKTLRVWDLTSCSTVQHFRARNYLQTCCDVSRDGQQFLAGSSGSGNELTLWDRRNEKKPIREFRGHLDSVESCMFFSYKDIKLVCSVSRDSTIRLWELDSGQELHCQLLSGSGPLTDLKCPATEILACSSFTGEISLWTWTPTANTGPSLMFHTKY